MIDLRFVWDDGPAILLFCSSGLKHILLQARVVHHLPLITTEELAVLLSAINDFTISGHLWDRTKWCEQLGRQFAIYGGSTDATYPRSKPRVTFEDEVEEAQMTESQPQNDYPQTAPSQPTVFNLDDNDAPTEQEIPVTLDAMHASMTVDDARRILIEHPLPKARQRTNVCTDEYIPHGRLFGAFTTRGEGITQAIFRFPLAIAAIMCLAATRGAAYSDEGFLSAQLNCSTSLPIHQDKNNHGDSWLTGLGDYEGGRLWVESPFGIYPPPNATESWHHNLHGDYHDIHTLG